MHVKPSDALPKIMLARYYGANLGRFLSVDPVDDTDLSDPQRWHSYDYVRNNPIRWTDPLGTKIKFDGPKKWKKAAKKAFKEARKTDKHIKRTWKALKKSDNLHTITPYTKTRTFNQTKPDSMGKAGDGTGTGSTVYFDPSSYQNADGQPSTPGINAAHEMSHMEDADTGTRNPTPEPSSGIGAHELKAVQFENIVRRAHPTLPERTTYANRQIPKVFVSSMPPTLR